MDDDQHGIRQSRSAPDYRSLDPAYLTRFKELDDYYIDGIMDDRCSLFEELTISDFEPQTRDKKKSDQNSLARSAIAYAKSMIGSGILFLPRAFDNSGWLFGVMSMGFFAWINVEGMIKLAECHAKFGDSYPSLGREAFGSIGQYSIALQVAVMQFCVTITAMNFSCEMISNLVLYAFSYNIPRDAVFILQLVVIIPLCWIRHIAKMRHTNFLATFIIFASVCYLLSISVTQIYNNSVDPEVAFFRPNTCLSFIGTACYAYEGIALVIPIRAALRDEDKHLFEGLLRWMTFFIFLFITSFGLIGYLAFGPNTKPIFLSQPESGTNLAIFQFLYACAVLCGLPLALYPTFNVFETQIFSMWPASPARKWSKNCFRTGLVTCAAYLSARASQNIGIYVSGVGIFCGVPIAIILPGLLHLKLFPEQRDKVDLLLVTCGFAIIPLCAYVNYELW